ncbi:MAG: AMP-dependent synthetase and ligase [Hydrocarboniphaga sp.]|nr:AMP-dependent synthetase and ligase [Hydrocarboniphaga sp.]
MRPAPSADNPAAWIDAVLATDPQRRFLTTPEGRQLSYAELAAATARIGVALAQLGVVAGDRVAVQVDKSVEALLLGIACLRSGAVLVPFNTAYMPAELDYFIGDSQPRLVVCRPQDRASIQTLARPHGVERVETLGAQGDGSLTEAIAAADPARFLPFAGKGDALAALLYTSGTTGRSKGAMITRRNLAASAVSLVEAWKLSAGDVLLHALPIFHVHGLFISSNAILAAGAGMLFLPRFDAAEVLARLREVTVMMGVPTFYTRLLQLPGFDRAACSNIRLFVSGSAPLLAETHREFEARTGHGIVERYGMTETQVNSSNPYDAACVPGSVGFPLPGVEIRITDAASGAVLFERGATGMIEVRGANVFGGYWRNPEKTAADLRPDGFFITGDVGRFDDQGYLFIVGRAKDLVITGGYNVYPIEVETEIDALPGVLESAVIGVPHPDFGEGVTAVVLTQLGATLTEAQVIEALRPRLASYKLPKRVLFAAELPRNALGKVQKNLLRRAHAELYQAG